MFSIKHPHIYDIYTNDNAAANLNILRKWVGYLGKAKDKHEQSIKSVMRKNAMSFKHLLNTVNKIFHA
jgi:hypothetical protein